LICRGYLVAQRLGCLAAGLYDFPLLSGIWLIWPGQHHGCRVNLPLALSNGPQNFRLADLRRRYQYDLAGIDVVYGVDDLALILPAAKSKSAWGC